MTSLQIPFIHTFLFARSRVYHAESHTPNFHREQLMMKALLLGMLISAAVGPLVVEQVAPGDTTISDLSWSLVGATLGSAVCLCLPSLKPADITAMARQFIGNACGAIALGPSAAWLISQYTGWPLNPKSIVAVSAILGMCGLAVLAAVLPLAISTFSSAIPAAIRRGLGIPEPINSKNSAPDAS